jgi:hypothetical protein
LSVWDTEEEQWREEEVEEDGAYITLKEYLLMVREGILYSLKDEDKNVIFFIELVDYYRMLVRYIIQLQRGQIINLQGIVSGGKRVERETEREKYAFGVVYENKFPSYLSQERRDRVLLLGLASENALYVEHLIRRIKIPRVYIMRGEDISIQWRGAMQCETFKLLCKNLPRRKEEVHPKLLGYIDQYTQYIWQTSQQPMPKMKTLLTRRAYEGVKTSPFNTLVWEVNGRKFEFVDILMQVLCLHMKNWYYLWCMLHYPSYMEIRKRLIFLKEVERWRIPPQVLCTLLK